VFALLSCLSYPTRLNSQWVPDHEVSTKTNWSIRHYFFHLWSRVQTLGCCLNVESPRNSSVPQSLGRDRVAPTPYSAEVPCYSEIILKAKHFLKHHTSPNFLRVSRGNDPSCPVRFELSSYPIMVIAIFMLRRFHFFFQ